MKPIFFLILILVLAHLAYSDENVSKKRAISRIAGGEEAAPHSIPYQVALFFINSYACGGSLISDKWVLTSATCASVSTKLPVVVLGAHRLQEQEDTQVVLTGINVIIHKDYDAEDSYKNDIALVELPEAVTLNEFIQTVALPPRKAGAYIGELGRVSGWGSGDLYNTTIATALKYYNATIISNVACQNVYGIGDTIYMSKMCLEGSEGSTCSGDYGGPLVIKDDDGNPLQVGISTGVGLSGGCHANYPPAFTRVSSFIDWIEQYTGMDLP